MTIPQLLTDLLQLLFDLAVPASMCTMVLAGLALRQESGVNFEVGGRFQKWMLWSVILLTLPQFLSWFAAQGITMPPQGAGISGAWVRGMETSVTGFISDVVVAKLVPILAAFFVLKAALDAPACLLPNGNVLCCVGALALSGPDKGFSTPAEFFEFDPISGTLIPAPAPAIAGISPTYNCRLLILPTGQALLSACSDGGASFDMAIYTPSGGPRNAWRPEITHVPHRLHPGHAYRLHGRQLNGLSQACAYGDDQQMATNYPLVCLWGRPAVGAVYCRTFDHSTMGVATGKAIHHTHFEVPNHIPHGKYRLVVIANGIASHHVEVHVERP